VFSGKDQVKRSLGEIDTDMLPKRPKEDVGGARATSYYRTAQNEYRETMSDAVDDVLAQAIGDTVAEEMSSSKSGPDYSDLDVDYGEDSVASRPPKYTDEEIKSISFIPDFDIETDIPAAMEAFAAIESRGSGDYQALGPIIKKGMYKGDRAYGRYQVMGDNVPSFTKQYIGKSMTKEDFLNDPEAQDAVIESFLRKKYKEYGNVEDAVSAWFTGQPLKKAQARGASDGNSTVNEYVTKFVREFLKQDS